MLYVFAANIKQMPPKWTHDKNHGIEHVEKGNLMTIKEKVYIHHFNQLNKLIEEQKYTKESDNQTRMVNILIKHQYMPTHITRHKGISAR
jgi:hypothetical protein